MYSFDLKLDALVSSSVFAEATAEELRVLLALASLGGEATKTQLSALASVGETRVASAIALFTEAGVLVQKSNIIDEFEDRVYKGEIEEESGLAVAKGIRDNSLRDLLDSFALKMNKSALTPFEVKRITGLCTQYGLSAEFIALYMEHLDAKGKLTSANKLVSGAIRLTEEGVNTVEELEIYIKERELSSERFTEIKKLLGIYGRRLSKSEEGYFNKWTLDFGFGAAIIGEAYDITAISTGKASLKYMDTILTEWYKEGARTVEDCRRIYDKRKSEQAASSPQRKREGERKPRYGNFDPEEAMRNAINNSFLDDDDE